MENAKIYTFSPCDPVIFFSLDHLVICTRYATVFTVVSKRQSSYLWLLLIDLQVKLEHDIHISHRMCYVLD